MARFGMMQDPSGMFGSFYAEYQSRLEANAAQAGRRAEEEQTAADNDAIDRWQQGEMTDEEFLAYAAERVAATAEDPTRNAYWKKVQRDTQKSILTEEVSNTAEDLINQIQAGTKTWNDLLAYYQNAQKSLKPSDPLYEDLSKQIEKVNDQVRDNQVAGDFARIQYQFEAGQMTGKSAGAQLRKMAEQYRVNDPAKYYQILQQAVGLERYGGTYGSGGSGGSGRGSSAKPLTQMIDALQGQRDRIGSLSEQYESGVKIGAITVENADGSLSTEEMLLTNPDGTPSEGMKSLDGQMIETLNQLEQTYIEKGDRSAAAGVANYRMGYITDHIQPRNTVGPQQQAAAILQGGMALVEQAAESDDPTLAWGEVQSWARQVATWESKLNTTTVTTRYTGKTLGKGPDDRIGSQGPDKALEQQTTGAFAGEVANLTAFAKAVADKDSAGAQSALAAVGGDETAVKRVTAAIDLVTGIPENRYVRAYVPGEGLIYVPVADSYTTEIDPATGQLATMLRKVPVDAAGKPIFDESKGEQLVDVMVQIGGRVQAVKGVSQPVFMVDGKSVTEAQYQTALKDTKASHQTQQVRSMLVPGQNGAPAQNWIYDPSRELWFKNTLTKSGGVPMPFVGQNAKLAQKFVNDLGLDPKGASYYDLKAEAARQAHQQRPASGADWYSQAQSSARLADQRQARSAAATAFGKLPDSVTQMPFISTALKQMATQLGVRSFDAPTLPSKPTAIPNYLGKLPGLGDTTSTSLPKITLPSVRTTAPIESGRYAGKPLPL